MRAVKDIAKDFSAYFLNLAENLMSKLPNTAMILIDLSKAFDTINHKILLLPIGFSKIQSVGMNPN